MSENGCFLLLFPPPFPYSLGLEGFALSFLPFQFSISPNIIQD